MPTDTKVLGFSNIRYEDGFKHSIEKTVDGLIIKTFSLPYLLASKIEAFKGRGKGNFLLIHDIEDIVTLFDGRSLIADDLKTAKVDVFKYLRLEFSNFLSSGGFESAIEAHISDRQNTVARKNIVLERLKSFLD